MHKSCPFITAHYDIRKSFIDILFPAGVFKCVAVGQPQIALLQYNEMFYVALMQILKIDLSFIKAHQLNRMRGFLCTGKRNSIPVQGVLI
jgi:hypothetical protein